MDSLKTILTQGLIDSRNIKKLSESMRNNLQQLIEQTEFNSMLYASTSPEKMPNSSNVTDNGLVAPTDTATYPDIETVVYSATIPEILKAKNLSVFKPIRKTAIALDVLKIGATGKDYTQGAAASFEFTSASTDTIEASHNGLLVIARLIDTYNDAGRPANTKFYVKMGQAKRYGTYLNLKSLLTMGLSSKGKFAGDQWRQAGYWSTPAAAALVPADALTDLSLPGKTIRATYPEKSQRLNYFNNTSGCKDGIPLNGLVNSKTKIPMPATPSIATFIDTYFGKPLNDATLVADWKKLWTAYVTNYNDNIKAAVKLWTTVVGIPIPALDAMYTENLATYPGDPAAKVKPIIDSKKLGYFVPTSTAAAAPPKTTSGEYEIGKSKN